MAFLDHIKSCNAHDLSRFVPFRAPAGEQIGWVRRDRVDLLKAYPEVFRLEDEAVQLLSLDGMAAVCADLHQKGIIKHWRDELYAVNRSFGASAVFEIERCAVSFFGIRAYGVHINGFVRTDEGIKVWVGKRSMDRAICPGMYDNIVAGGQPAGLSLMDNIIKECAEEANIPAGLAKKATPVGAISYIMETEGGIKPDVMFCYDLELPQDFTPVNTDGETEEFYLWSLEELADHVRGGGNFKFNCNLVIIDFLIRHGYINPDEEADYEQLVSGLTS